LGCRTKKFRHRGRPDEATGLSLAKTRKSWEADGVKTITLEEIYADPHVLEPLLAGSETVEITQAGKALATLRPSIKPNGKYVPKSVPKIDAKARFLAMHGPDAFKSTRSVEEIIDAVRDPRDFFRNE
jgi:hypothetical protein